MQRFDALARDAKLFGPHLLEASAGTGKTFAIEHVFARLILEGLELEEILAITFTRAATRDLRTRIRDNLARIVRALRAGETPFPYLENVNSDAKHRIEEALLSFERAKIFTIHGACQRMLTEFSPRPMEEGDLTPYQFDFLEGPLDWAPAQLERVTRRGLDNLFERRPLEGPDIHLSALLAELDKIVKPAPAPLLESFEAVAPNYKKVAGDHRRQTLAFGALLEGKGGFEELLWEKGSLFEFLAPENRSKRAKNALLPHPLFDWGREHLLPLIERALDPKRIQAGLAADWEKWWHAHPKSRELFTPDALLAWTAEAARDPAFVERARRGIRAAILDEFQDTDPVQWDIFERLFVDHPDMRALYLVGDPKQSIYRFRGADIYTYLKAKERLGAENCYALDTNYRSNPSLVTALNALLGEPFCKPWLHLPKQQISLPYLPVRAGKAEEPIEDGRGAVHVMEGETEEALIEWIAAEASAHLRERSIAVLVRDRNQLARVRERFEAHGIPTHAKNQQPLHESLPYQHLRACMEAVLRPRDVRRIRAVLTLLRAEEEEALRFFGHLRELLEEQGLPACVGALSRRLGDALPLEWEQSVEALLAHPASIPDFFRTFPLEETNRRTEGEPHAVELLTMHASKGLEYDLVFALGLIARSREEENDEEAAETLRQLYVAVTRPRQRLYLPQLGAERTPLARLQRHWDGPLDALTGVSLTRETVAPRAVAPVVRAVEAILPETPLKPRARRRLLSFTALARGEEGGAHAEMLEGELPRGTETGVIVHRIFEEVLQGRPMPPLETLEPWREALTAMVQTLLEIPLIGGQVPLLDIPLADRRVEVEFLTAHSPHYIAGAIDLMVRYRGDIYLVDWKTNALPAYDQPHLEQAMRAGDYFLQAALYAHSLGMPVKAAHYVFVRGLKNGIYTFQPDLRLIDGIANA